MRHAIMTAVLMLALSTSKAWADDAVCIQEGATLCKCPTVPENSARTYTLQFTQDGRCSTATSVFCLHNDECPTGQTCSGSGLKTTPSAVTYRIDDPGAKWICVGGTKAGKTCDGNTTLPCPGGTCTPSTEAILLATQTVPGGSLNSSISITIAAGVNTVKRGTNVDHPDELHIMTVCWAGTGYDECRECELPVRRQRFSQ